MMIVLSDEPKALVLAAERLIESSKNIANQYSVDSLAMKINEFVREMRASDIGFIGTSGFFVFRHLDEGHEEIRIFLEIGSFYKYDGEPDQQFVKHDGPFVYDESVPEEWRDED